MINTAEATRVLETALICAQQPLSLRDMRVLFQEEVGNDTLKDMLADLAAQPFSVTLLLANVEEVSCFGVAEMGFHAIALNGASTMNATAASRELKQRRT